MTPTSNLITEVEIMQVADNRGVVSSYRYVCGRPLRTNGVDEGSAQATALLSVEGLGKYIVRTARDIHRVVEDRQGRSESNAMSNATEFDRSRDGEWGCRPEVIISEMRRCGTDCENVWNNKNDEIRGLFGTHGVIPHHSLDTFCLEKIDEAL